MRNIKKLVGIGIMSVMLSTSVFAAGKLPKEAADKKISTFISTIIYKIFQKKWERLILTRLTIG